MPQASAKAGSIPTEETHHGRWVMLEGLQPGDWEPTQHHRWTIPQTVEQGQEKCSLRAHQWSDYMIAN